MTALVQQSVELSIEAVFSRDTTLMEQVIEGDDRIDVEEIEVERQAIDLLALFQPAAGDLRLITTIIKVNVDFERIADCAVNIAQRAQYLEHLKPVAPPADLKAAANSVVSTLREAIKAFNLSDEQVARRVLQNDRQIDELYQRIVLHTLAAMQRDPSGATHHLAHLMIAKNLERVADHCTNIGEAVEYVHSGRIVRHHATVL